MKKKNNRFMNSLKSLGSALLVIAILLAIYLVWKLRRDSAADLAVLFVVERDEHGLRVVLVLHRLEGAQKLFDKAAACVPLTAGPADS